MQKDLIRNAILNRLAADLSVQTSAAQLARDEATSEESRAENKYDTHSQEAAYLAEGQARLAAEIESNIAFYHSFPIPGLAAGDPIVPGALVALSGPDGPTLYFLGPRAGGLEFTAANQKILLVTPQSPLGRALLGRRAGESVSVGTRLLGIEAVA